MVRKIGTKLTKIDPKLTQKAQNNPKKSSKKGSKI
jgi:hypothetical protein